MSLIYNTIRLEPSLKEEDRLKTKVGYSENPEAFAAGVETAKMAGVIDNPQVGLLFTSCVLEQEKVMEGVKSVLGDVPVVGCTSSAAICTQDGYLNKETGYVGMMLFGGNVKASVAGSKKTEESAREIGRRLAKDAMAKLGNVKHPDFIFMSASPAEEEEYMKGIEDVVGSVNIFGGSAADNTVEGKWSLLNNGEAFADGCVIAIFYTDSKYQNLYTGEYNETKDSGIITEVIGKRTLAKIDGVPAVTKYCEWTGKSTEEVAGGNLLSATIFNPLGVKDPIGSVTAIRHPMAANEDLSMNIGANLAVNTAVVRMHLEPEEMVDANPNAIKKVNELMNDEVNSYFLVHCGGRRLGLQLEGIEDKIYPAVKNVTGNKEFLMVFTFGEYGKSDHSANTVGGLSLSFTGFGD